MKRRKVIVLVGALVAGIVSADAQPSFSPRSRRGWGPTSPNTMLISPGMPPAPRFQARGRAPGPGMVWAPGSWAWRGGGWVWVDGGWISPPGPRAVWTPGHWSPYRRGGVWVGGYWQF
ncbi:MAG TPA: hypothetical protein VKV04_23550 [Verrucomicrobiae bacterium]|nr:hypothetical protein [Verrucomicrobiae bacterium]